MRLMIHRFTVRTLGTTEFWYTRNLFSVRPPSYILSFRSVSSFRSRFYLNTSP